MNSNGKGFALVLWFLFLVVAIVGLPALGAASEVAVEHGKLRTFDATPVETGKYEVEFSYHYTLADKVWDNEGHWGDRRKRQDQTAGLTLVTGLLRNLDFHISLDYVWLQDEENLGPTKGNGLGDLRLGIRYRFLNRENQKWEMAWFSGLTVPSGSRSDLGRLGTSQEFWSWENALVLTKDWGRLTTNGEIGYLLPFGDARGTARGSLVVPGSQLGRWIPGPVLAATGRGGEFFQRLCF